MTDELKPCPFCGATNVVICNGSMGLLGFCRNCGTTAECGKGKYEATKKWNTRPIEDALIHALEDMLEEKERSFRDAGWFDDVEDVIATDGAMTQARRALALAKGGK